MPGDARRTARACLGPQPHTPPNNLPPVPHTTASTMATQSSAWPRVCARTRTRTGSRSALSPQRVARASPGRRPPPTWCPPSRQTPATTTARPFPSRSYSTTPRRVAGGVARVGGWGARQAAGRAAGALPASPADRPPSRPADLGPHRAGVQAPGLARRLLQLLQGCAGRLGLLPWGLLRTPSLLMLAESTSPLIFKMSRLCCPPLTGKYNENLSGGFYESGGSTMKVGRAGGGAGGVEACASWQASCTPHPALPPCCLDPTHWPADGRHLRLCTAVPGRQRAVLRGGVPQDADADGAQVQGGWVGA